MRVFEIVLSVKRAVVQTMVKTSDNEEEEEEESCFEVDVPTKHLWEQLLVVALH
jgi:hypothetical protein